MDTATPAVTVALHDGTSVVAESTGVDARRHGELLLPAVDRVLKEAGTALDAVTGIVVGVGPGPYTGLRVGLVTARTLGHVLEVPVYGVCTLDVIAAEAARGGVDRPFLVATDARRKEVYLASYDEHGTRLTGPVVDKPAALATDAPVAGGGAALYPEAFPARIGPEGPSAGWLARCVAEELVELLDPEPLYLRRPDAVAPGAPKPVS